LLSIGDGFIYLQGSINTDRWIVQRLADAKYAAHNTSFGQFHANELRLFMGALRLGLEDLQEFFIDCSQNLAGQNPPSPFFPAPKAYPSRGLMKPTSVPFSYVQNLKARDSGAAVFLATVGDEKVVVKFVQRYGKDAHHKACELGLAPRLRYVGPPYWDDKIACSYEGAHMVVMDFVEDDSIAMLTQVNWEVLKDKVGKLHEAGFVHGDLRAPNIIMTTDGPNVLDWDWAGEKGAVVYPEFLNTSLFEGLGLQGVKAHELITEEHDNLLLARLLP
jgi:hypothetical protein